MQEDLQKSDGILDAFSKIVSGKAGYKTVIEKKKEIIKCPECTTILEGTEKFCPECGHKLK